MAYNKCFFSLVIIVLSNYLLSGCYSNSILTDYSVERKIYKIETNDKEVIEFEDGNFANLVNDKIIQISSSGEKKVFKKSDVKKIFWEYEQVRVYKIETIDGEVIEIKDDEIAYLLLNSVVVTKLNGKRTDYSLSKIKNVYISNFSVVNTLGLIVVIPFSGILLLGVFVLLGLDLSPG